MPAKLDQIDRRILAELQADAEQSLEDLAKKVGASKTPVWNRIKKLKAAGVITNTVALVDPEEIGLSTCFFVFVRTSAHEKEWQEKFLAAIQARPEVLEAHRLAGDIDYVLKVRVPDARAYDAFYQALISEVSIFEVTSTMSMEEIKNTTALSVLTED